MTTDQIIAALMDGVDPWELQQEAGSDRVNEAIALLEQRV